MVPDVQTETYSYLGIGPMIRFQARLTDRQHDELRKRARAQGTSVAALIRRAVDNLLATESSEEDATKRALSVIGCIRDAPDLAEKHDDYLAETYGQ